MHSIPELCSRYNLQSKKSLYSRLNGLKEKGIDADFFRIENRSYASDELVAQLDLQDEHLKKSGTIQNFEPFVEPKVEVEQDGSWSSPSNGLPDNSVVETTHQVTTENQAQEIDKTEAVSQIINSVSNLVREDLLKAISTKEFSPIEKLKELEEASEKGWHLTTKQVAYYVGIRPRVNFINDNHEQFCVRGSFWFKKSGKIGNQTSWIVRVYRQKKVEEENQN